MNEVGGRVHEAEGLGIIMKGDVSDNPPECGGASIPFRPTRTHVRSRCVANVGALGYCDCRF
eukprot:1766989-Pyramimonas_sp.AAC.1